MRLWHELTGFAFFNAGEADRVCLLTFENSNQMLFQEWIHRDVPTPRVGDTVMAPIQDESGEAVVRKRYTVVEVIWDYGHQTQRKYLNSTMRLVIKVQEAPV